MTELDAGVAVQQEQSADVVEERAYKEAGRLPVTKIASYVLDMLGQKISAVALGLSDARPIKAWIEGGDIREENDARLRLLYRIARTVATLYDEATARAFLRSSSPYLDDRAPIILVSEGAEGQVLEAMRSFLEG